MVIIENRRGSTLRRPGEWNERNARDAGDPSVANTPAGGRGAARARVLRSLAARYIMEALVWIDVDDGDGRAWRGLFLDGRRHGFWIERASGSVRLTVYDRGRVIDEAADYLNQPPGGLPGCPP